MLSERRRDRRSETGRKWFYVRFRSILEFMFIARGSILQLVEDLAQPLNSIQQYITLLYHLLILRVLQ